MSNAKMRNLAPKILRLTSFISASESTLWFKINYTKTLLRLKRLLLSLKKKWRENSRTSMTSTVRRGLR